MKKLLITIVTVGLLAALVAAPASAHVSVVKRSPGKGDTAPTSLDRVWVKFSGPLRSGTLKVFKASNGKKVSRGSGRVDPRNARRLICSLKGGKGPGGYIAKWTLVGADGHSQRGSWRFRLVR